MTSLMQFFGDSLNNMAKLRLHEKENSIRRNTLVRVVSAFKALLLLSDETETIIHPKRKESALMMTINRIVYVTPLLTFGIL